MKRGRVESFGLVKRKRSQQLMGMSFGVIFSIFMILVFIVLGFIVIRHFLDIGNCSQIGMFYSDLQEEIDNAWKQQYHEGEFDINLPSGINRICFGNLSSEISGLSEDYAELKSFRNQELNVFLIPAKNACDMPAVLIKHIDIEKITAVRNPYCVDVPKALIVKKGFSDKAVVIE